MADCCSYCELNKPTNHLVLNGGKLWIEFCDDCGNERELTNEETGETVTVKQLFDRRQDEPNRNT
jgi:hypothetical protein